MWFRGGFISSQISGKSTVEIDMSLLGETRKDLRLENFPEQLSCVLCHCSCSSPHPIPSCKWLYLLTYPPTTLDIKTPDCLNIQTPTSDPLFPLLFLFWDSLFLFILKNFINFWSEDNCFTILCWFLPYINIIPTFESTHWRPTAHVP